jgi:hypothetical protein
VSPPLPSPEPLAPYHHLAGFDCGEPEINDFLLTHAAQETAAGLSRTWVIARPGDQVVLGFVSLSAASQPVRVKIQGKPKKLLSGHLASCPYPDAPMVLLGRLGRRSGLAHAGLGTRLLSFAIVQTLKAAEHIGIAGIILDAMTDDLLGYYRKMKFERLPYPDPRKRRMLLTIADAKATAARLGG